MQYKVTNKHRESLGLYQKSGALCRFVDGNLVDSEAFEDSDIQHYVKTGRMELVKEEEEEEVAEEGAEEGEKEGEKEGAEEGEKEDGEEKPVARMSAADKEKLKQALIEGETQETVVEFINAEDSSVEEVVEFMQALGKEHEVAVPTDKGKEYYLNIVK